MSKKKCNHSFEQFSSCAKRQRCIKCGELGKEISRVVKLRGGKLKAIQFPVLHNLQSN